MCKAKYQTDIIYTVSHTRSGNESLYIQLSINSTRSLSPTHSTIRLRVSLSPPRTHIYIADFVLTWYQHACDQCGKSYKTRKSLSRHRRFECRFTTERPIFQCPSCNYAAKRSDNLTKHIKTHFAKMKKDFLPLAFQMQASTGINSKWEATA
ncbi:hypothetical protein M5D96_010272 [Drosophila gunungcola]|uniref:C2H2-type domain-containing protein n=1 Tax=Drosophila gunungcola TaxID=103775 RepID=A0A9P9YHA2_9MUSC|nr:hypothetical protein M5D96_010272 [Drosophila gunungcola]